MVMIVLVDAHCHLMDMKDYKPSKDVIPIAASYSHNKNVKNVEIAKKFKVPFTLGIAPQSVIGDRDLTPLDEWIDFIRQNRPNAVGEIGLDYHWAKGEEDIKKEELVFKKMLDLAEELELPVVIHSRKATQDVIDTFEMRNFELPVMMHFFSGNVSEAKWFAERGNFISITPMHSKSRKEVIKEIPLENLLVETDAPYVVRTPEHVKESVEYIAEVKGLDFDRVAEQTTKNARSLFKF